MDISSLYATPQRRRDGGFAVRDAILKPVRRLAAFSVLLWMVLMPLQPLLASAAQESRLPACCRRNGAHHCAMMLQADAALAGGTQAPIATSHCPYWKFSLAPAVVAAAHISRGVLTRPVPSHCLSLRSPISLPSSGLESGSSRSPPVANSFAL